MDFLLGTDGDLDLTRVAGDVSTVDGLEAVAQQIRIRFAINRGEWFLDSRVGVPWYTDILVKSPNMAKVNYILKRVISTTPRVTSVPFFRPTVNPDTRELSVDFTAILDSGEILDSRVFGPFIIDLSGFGG